MGKSSVKGLLEVKQRPEQALAEGVAEGKEREKTLTFHSSSEIGSTTEHIDQAVQNKQG